MAYLTTDDPDLEDASWEWKYTLGFYDNRDFWMTEEEMLMPAPLKWALITDPEPDANNK